MMQNRVCLFFFLLFSLLLCSCGVMNNNKMSSENMPVPSVIDVQYDSSFSSKQYPADYAWKAKTGDYLYAVTVEMPEEVRIYLEDLYSGNKQFLGSLGYVIPVHFPEHQQYEGERDYIVYFITIHGQEGALNNYIVVSIDAQSNRVEGVFDGPIIIDWQSLTGYTSKENPMYLYHEGLHYYAVIGDKAYCLSPEFGGRIQATDSFIPADKLRIENILKK